MVAVAQIDLNVSSIHARLLQKEAQFTLAEAQSYVAEVLRLEVLHEDKRFEKKFLEEFWPLTAIAQYLGEHTHLIYRGFSNAVDAELLLGDAPPQPIEFTIAFDAEQEALRDEHMKLYGRAPITAVLPRPSGTRASGSREMPEVEADFWSRDEQRELAFRRMKMALERKQAAALKRADYSNAWLGIVVDNNQRKEKKQNFYDPIARSLLVSRFEPFSRVFVVSTVGDYVFDSATLVSRLLSMP